MELDEYEYLERAVEFPSAPASKPSPLPSKPSRYSEDPKPSRRSEDPKPPQRSEDRYGDRDHRSWHRSGRDDERDRGRRSRSREREYDDRHHRYRDRQSREYDEDVERERERERRRRSIRQHEREAEIEREAPPPSNTSPVTLVLPIKRAGLSPAPPAASPSAPTPLLAATPAPHSRTTRASPSEALAIDAALHPPSRSSSFSAAENSPPMSALAIDAIDVGPRQEVPKSRACQVRCRGPNSAQPQARPPPSVTAASMAHLLRRLPLPSPPSI